MRWTKYILISSATILMLGSCADDEFTDGTDGLPASDVIGYSIRSVMSRAAVADFNSAKTATELIATSGEQDSLWIYMSETPSELYGRPAGRGTQMETSTINSFDVSCVRTVNGMYDPYFHNEAYTGTAGPATWTNVAGNTYYWWPEDAQFDFYALSPSKAVTGDPATEFTFAVNNTVKNQIDLCAATVKDATHGQPVALSFRHLLSRIIFKVPEATELATGKINSIELSNIKSSGKYSSGTESWTLSDDTYTYKLTPETGYESGADLSANGLQLFLMPQALDKNSILTLTFQPTRNGANSGGVKTYTKQLTGIDWEPGMTYVFNVSISPQGFFEFTQDAPIQDANYVMHTNTIRPLEGVGNSSWRAEVRTSDGADVTIQKEADVNVIARSGFWTDRIQNTSGGDTGSARGTNTISGTGMTEVPVRIFLPENVTETNRIVYVDFYLGSETTPAQTLTLLQYCPDWVGSYGWEQIDDNESGDFGFNWTRKVCLTYKYSIGITDNTTDRNYVYADGIRNQYIDTEFSDRANWTGMGTFYRRVGYVWERNYRCYIELDYSKVNDLKGSTSSSDGLTNTWWLNRYGGNAATMGMESGILSIMKSDGTAPAFRIATTDDDGPNAPTSTLTEVNANAIAISIALRKNRYNIRQTAAAEDGQIGYTPQIAEIQWYLPAVGQFGNLPKLEPITPGEYWSSTTQAGADGLILDGSGVGQNRNTVLKVRACRTKP